MPRAINAAAFSQTFECKSHGWTSTVSAWRSARKNRHSASSCIRTQRRIAPSRLPRCKPPVGWMPETTRILVPVSAGIGVGPPAPQQCPKLLLVGAAQHPDEREIDDHPAEND